MITQLRLAWRLQRWELAFVVVASLGLAAAAFWQAADMRSMLTGCGTAAAAPACELVYAYQDSHGGGVGLTQSAIHFVPFVAGLVLGVPLVAREIEQRTALIAWPLAQSRLRWLAWRLAPLMLVALAVISTLAVAADQMAHAYFPNSDLGFIEYEARGLPLVMRSALMLVAGVTIGAVVGRVLPALLVGIGLSVALGVVLAMALPYWAPSRELGGESAIMYPGSLNTDLQYRMPDGRQIDAETAERMIEAAYQAAYEADPEAEPDPSTLPQAIFFGIAASRYPEVLVRESAVLGVAIVGAGALAFVAVGRRRPE